MSQPVLPLSSTLPIWIAGSWACVVAMQVLCIALVITRRCQVSHIWALGFAVLIACSVIFPSTRGWTAYLALAFQTPSLVSVVWAITYSWRVWQKRTEHVNVVIIPCIDLPLALCGVLLGWALWLDTLNLLPAVFNIQLQLFDLGFSNNMLWSVCGLIGLLGSLAHYRTTRAQRSRQTACVISSQANMFVYNWVAIALLLFTITRWPTGNLWDAVLDIWVWFSCHIVLIRRLKSLLTLARTPPTAQTSN